MAELIIQWGAIVSGLTTIVAATIWLYKKLVAEPDQKVEERLIRESNIALERTVVPLTQSIDNLNYLLQRSEEDRKCLHEKNDEQDNILDNHEVRITVLEDWRGRKGEK